MDTCTHHSVRCERASRYKLLFIFLTNSHRACHARSAWGWDSSYFCATCPALEALTEQEWPILLTLRTPRKRLHIPACEACTPENHGEGLKLSPLGEGESHSDPGALLQVWQCWTCSLVQGRSSDTAHSSPYCFASSQTSDSDFPAAVETFHF